MFGPDRPTDARVRRTALLRRVKNLDKKENAASGGESSVRHKMTHFWSFFENEVPKCQSTSRLHERPPELQTYVQLSASWGHQNVYVWTSELPSI